MRLDTKVLGWARIPANKTGSLEKTAKKHWRGRWLGNYSRLTKVTIEESTEREGESRLGLWDGNYEIHWRYIPTGGEEFELWMRIIKKLRKLSAE